jgi:peptide/nickel transport system permease protein
MEETPGIFSLDRLRAIRLRPTLVIGVLVLVVPLVAAQILQVVQGEEAIALGAYDFNLPPSHEHRLGTDGYGRDVVAMLAFALWPTLKVGLVAGITAVTIGTVLGLLSGYAGGSLDWGIRGLTDVLLGIPVLPILIVVAAYLGSVSVASLGVVIGLVAWPFTARVVRAQVLSLRESFYIEMATLSGARRSEILLLELLPNLLPYLAAGFVGAVSGAILASVGLQILGLGSFGLPTLGMMLDSAYQGGALSRGLWWWFVPPALLLILIFVGLFLISLAIDQIANPRLRKGSS